MEMTKILKWIPAKEEILSSYPECNFDKLHEDALLKELVYNKYIICGDTHQSECHNCIPVFEDGYLLLSMRRWSSIMSVAYCYINKYRAAFDRPNFYMACTCSIKEKLPK